MTRRSKVAVVAVLGLGVLASVAALMRIISYKYIDTRKYPDDHYGRSHMHFHGVLLMFLVAQGRLLLWSVLESSLAIIACSLPSLKVFGGCLARSMNRSKGTPKPVSRSTPHSSRALLTTWQKLPYNSSTPLHPLNPSGHTRTQVSGKGNWDRLHDDDSSAKHIIVESQVEVDSRSMHDSHKASNSTFH